MILGWTVMLFCVCCVAFTGTSAQIFTALLVVWATFLVIDSQEPRR